MSIAGKNASAGWYHCYNFKGSIDKYAVSFSMQIADKYFGEPGKKDFNLVGVYKYDKHNEPIRLEGKMSDSSKQIILYETINNKHTACFKFTFSDTECTGTWKDLSTNKTLPLHLVLVSGMKETSLTDSFTNVEILQANALPHYYFTGIYSKKSGEERAHMDHLEIRRKADNTLFQTIDFSKIETATGNVMTIIYNNVEITDLATQKLLVWNNIGRMGGYLFITYNAKTKRFILNPKATIDGPN